MPDAAPKLTRTQRRLIFLLLLLPELAALVPLALHSCQRPARPPPDAVAAPPK